MLEALLFLPLGAGCIILLGTKAMCRVLLPLTALGHTALAAWTTYAVGTGAEPRAMNGLLAPDPLGALFLMLASLLKDLDGIMPDGGQIFSLIAHGFTERQVADKLGVTQSTLNYRKKKLFDYIRQHREDFLR